MERDHKPENGKIPAPLSPPDAAVVAPPDIHVEKNTRTVIAQPMPGNERHYRYLTTTAAQIFWTIKADGTVDDVPMWRAYTGQSLEEINGHGWLQAVHPDDLRGIYSEWKRALSDSNIFEVEYRLLRYDGIYRTFLAHGVPVFDNDGRVREWIGASTDITEKKLLADELRESEQRFRATFEQAAIGIAHVGTEGHFLLVNKKFCDIVGYTYEELQSSTFHKLQPIEDPIIIAKNAAKLKTDELQMWSHEMRYTRKDGLSIWVNLTLSLVRDASNQPAYFIATTEDITERKREEQRTHDALKALELAQREANRRMDEFLSIASHELRSPLTTISVHIQVANRYLRKSLLGESALSSIAPIQDMLNSTERQVAVLNRLVNDLIDISRIKTDKLKLHIRPQQCDLITLLQDVITNQQLDRTPARTIQLKLPFHNQEAISINSTPVPVLADPDRITQVITNYVTNALKYSAPDQPIIICLQTQGTMAHVSVHDEGPGLSTEEQAHVWERFYQASNQLPSHTTSPGLGLGLYISRSLIEQHGGQVGVESQPGQGSTFWFTLPLAL